MKNLKQLAIDLAEGKIFSNLSCSSEELLLVFMPFIFLDQEQKDELKDKVFVYEYISKAGPRSINGKPIFMSMNFLNETDYKTMMEEYKKYSKIREDFLKEPSQF